MTPNAYPEKFGFNGHEGMAGVFGERRKQGEQHHAEKYWKRSRVKTGPPRAQSNVERGTLSPELNTSFKYIKDEGRNTTSQDE